MTEDVPLTSVLDVVEEVVEGFGDVSGRATQLQQRVLVPKKATSVNKIPLPSQGIE
jgi:hypothetical protein